MISFFLAFQLIISQVLGWEPSCRAILKNDPWAPSGVYTLDIGENVFNVYCWFERTMYGTAFELIESFSRDNNLDHLFRRVSLERNAPRNELNAQDIQPNWADYRLPRWQMDLLVATAGNNADSLMVATCNRNMNSDFFISNVATMNPFNDRGNNNVYYEHIMVRNQLYHGESVASYQDYNCHWHVSGDWWYPFSGGIGSEDNFGFYGNTNTNHACVSSGGSTTNYWIKRRIHSLYFYDHYRHEELGFHCVYTDATTCWCPSNMVKDGSNICSSCKPDYFGTIANHCNNTYCDGIAGTESNVCGGHGECWKLNECVCESTDYTGQYCGEYYCGGTFVTEPTVCNSHGTCVAHDECDCHAGYFEQSTFVCVECGVGEWAPVGSSSCTPCDADKYTIDHTSCDCCPLGEFPNALQDGCDSCPAGFITAALCASCTQCGPGTVANVEQTSCDVCPDGYYEAGNRIDCVACEAGFYCSGGIREECPDGKYSSVGESECTPCAAGKRETNNTCVTCDEGMISVEASTICTMCSNATFASVDHKQCQLCTQGYYCNGTDGLRHECEVGEVATSLGLEECTPCPAGTYENNRVECLPCDSGWVSPEGSGECFLTCENGTYADVDLCRPCPPGHYCYFGQKHPCLTGYVSNGTLPCEGCPAGTREESRVDCVECDDGMISGDASGLCFFCPEGFYDDGNLHLSCASCEAGYYCTGGLKYECDPGKYTDAPGQTSCQQCLPGTFEANRTSCVECADGYIAAGGGAIECQICVPGTFASLDNVECNDCLAGSYCVDGLRYDCADGWTSGALATICTECPAGTKEEGNTVCTPCGAGRISAAGSMTCTKCTATSYASLDHTACTLCEPGFYCDGSDGTKRECVAGSTSSFGADTCTFCPRGTYELTHTACVPCDAGKYSLEGSIECTVCMDGTISNLTHCNDCPPGFFCTNGLPTECAAGYYSGFGASECDPCGAGTYEFNHVECLECPDGKFSVGGTATCDFCPITTYEDGSNRFCLQCDAGYYCDGSDGLRHPCGPTEAASTGSSSCTECGDTRYVNIDNSACLTCEAGYYCVNGSRYECPENHVQPLPAQTFCTECTGGLFPNADRTICHGCPANQIFTTVCENCTEGEYANNTLTCEDCIPGYYCTDGYRYPCGEGRWSGIRETSCSICGAGSYAAPDHSSCPPCDSGYYCDGTDGLKHPCLDGETSGVGEVSCSACSPGFYADALHQNCLVCEAGSYCQNGIMLPCADGSMSGAGADNCTICGPTLVATDSHLSCDPCTAAYYCPGDGFMYECDDGEYSNAAAASCTVCGPGTYGELSHLSCSACEAGKYCPGDGFFYPCDPGTVSAAGQDVCSDCLAGTYQAMGNKTDCLPCLPGWISSDKATTCSICDEGDWSDGGVQCLLCPEGSKCTGGIKTECQVGWIASTPGQTQCSECGSGYYQNNNHTFCEFCPEGYVSIAGVDTCTMCLIGTYENGLRTFCQQCSIGYYCDGFDGLRHECPDGFYTDSLAQSFCSVCLAGTHEVGHSHCEVCDDGQISGDAATTCEACNATTYEDGTHQNCLVCEASYYCPGDGIRYECAPGYISTDSADVCSMCLAGSYEVNHLSCEPCLNGSISTDASDTCSFCDEGLYDVGSYSCEPCLAGFYCSGGIITPCASGRISEAGKSVCSECVSGTYEKDHLTCEDCNDGEISAAGVDLCSVCQEGYYALDDNTFCLDCPAGSFCSAGLKYPCEDGYISDILQTECTPCPAGTYENSNTRCSPCEQGHVSDVEATTRCFMCSMTMYANENNTKCEICTPGWYCDGSDGTRQKCSVGKWSKSSEIECHECPTGTYENERTACLECPDGHIASAAGSPSCSKCGYENPGLEDYTTYANTAKDDCIICETGSYCPLDGIKYPCDDGHIAPNIGSLYCTSCQNGYYANGTKTGCVECPAGFYCHNGMFQNCHEGTYSYPGQSSCSQCEDGYIPNTLQTDCDECGQGMVSEAGDSVCRVCADGFYADDNHEYCLVCEELYFCSNGIKEACEPGQIAGMEASECTDCLRGTFQNHTECLECPEGFYCEDMCYDPIECTVGYWCPSGSPSQVPCDCTGNGDCIESPSDCVCWEDYTGENCEHWTCYDIASVDETVCTNMQGMCQGIDDCKCQNGYRGDQCETVSCFGIWNDTDDGGEKQELCTGHGVCVGKDSCNCTKKWSGERCDEKEKPKDVGSTRNTVMVVTGSIIGVVALLCVLACVIGIPSICIFTRMKKNLKQYKKYDKELELIKLEDEQTPGGEHTLAKFNISKKFFEIEANDLKLTEKIGEGGYAEVFKCEWDGKDVALKLFSGKHLQSSKDFKEFERELQILSSISHPNVMNFFGCMRRPPRLGIVVEYCSGGDLQTFIEDNMGKVQFERKLKILQGVASSIVYLHKRDIIHRDLKSANVLLTESLTPKLCDFGLSKVIQEKQGVFTRLVGTNIYMAPEIVIGSDYDVKADVFSFALMMYEVLLENFTPYGVNLKFNVEVKVATQPNYRPEVDIEKFRHCLWYSQMMQKAWEADPDERPSMMVIFEALKQKEYPPKMPDDYREKNEPRKKISVTEMMKVQLMSEDKQKKGDIEEEKGNEPEHQPQQKPVALSRATPKAISNLGKKFKDPNRPVSYNQKKLISMEMEMEEPPPQEEEEVDRSTSILDQLSAFDV